MNTIIISSIVVCIIGILIFGDHTGDDDDPYNDWQNQIK